MTASQAIRAAAGKKVLVTTGRRASATPEMLLSHTQGGTI